MTSKLEYLKRYEGNNSSVKKKRRIKKLANLTILDDDASWLASEDKSEAHLEDPEDAPIVAQVRDDSVVKWQPLSLVDDEGKKKRPSLVIPDNDLSPPRLKKRPISSINDEDLSPPRKIRKNPTQLLHKEEHHEDMSPPRKGRHGQTISHKYLGIERDCDPSPPRARRKPQEQRRVKKEAADIDDDDLSPPKFSKTLIRDGTMLKYKDSDISPTRKKPSYSQVDPTSSNLRQVKKTRVIYNERSPKSGRNDNSNTAVINSRSTSSADYLSKADVNVNVKKTSNHDKQFMEWGRGVAQTRGAFEKAMDEEYEMSKPLARYADDEDLDKMLKERRRDGDPMLIFMKKTTAGKEKDAHTRKGKPCYKGDSAPNRFGIRPGFRWDGVDRSNGYEKAWLTQASNKKAVAEESYKWSTEDM